MSSSALMERFWSKVDKDGPVPTHRPELGPCWVWTHSKTSHGGYGQISIGGRKGKPHRAHRVSFKMVHGDVPDGQPVLHLCDNPPCVRPDHLYLGTQAENMADMRSRGRSLNGERNSHAKLSDELASHVILLEGITSASRLARHLGVSRSSIERIWHGDSYRHLAREL